MLEWVLKMERILAWPDRTVWPRRWGRPKHRTVNRLHTSVDFTDASPSGIAECDGAEPETPGLSILLLADCLVVMQTEKIDSVPGPILPRPDFFNRPERYIGQHGGLSASSTRMFVPANMGRI